MTPKEKPFSTVAEGYSGSGLFHTPGCIRSRSKRAVFALKGESMNIDISGRHFDLTDALKTHVEDKVSAFERFYDGIDDVHVILEFTAGLNHAHISVRGDRLRLDSRSKSHDMYFAVDECVSSLERQIRRHKDRVHGHPHRGGSNGKQGTYYVPVEISELDKILLVENGTLLPRMTTNNAMTEFEVDGDDYLVFFNTETRSVNAVYRTPGGSSQVVELMEAGA